jgi:hypothetical protein
MGAGTKIFSLASQAGPTEAITPTSDTLLALNVINEGRKPAKWTIESVTGAIYLKGEQETALGITKFMLVCPAHEQMKLYAIFDASKNTDEVMSWKTNWLFVDGNQTQIDDWLQEKAVVNGWINLRYRLDNALLSAVVGARSVIGVGLSATPKAAVFSGFANMPFEAAAAKLPRFLEVCGHR